MPGKGSPITFRSALAQRKVLVAVAGSLAEEQTGGLLSMTLERLCEAVACRGALAFQSDRKELQLVSEVRLPRKAKPWLARLPLAGEPWFIAQRAAQTGRLQVDDDVAPARSGHSIKPIFDQAGWRAVAASPILIGRQVLGVLVLGAADSAVFTRDVLQLLHGISSMVALSLVRERDSERRAADEAKNVRTIELATIGLLASSVATDLAAPLGALQLQLDEQEQLVQTLGQRFAKRPPELAELTDLTSDLVSGLRRVHDVVARLMAFSQETQPEPVDLVSVVEASTNLVADELESQGILLSLMGIDEQLPVIGRRDNLHLMVVQLLLFAAQEAAASDDEDRAINVWLGGDGERQVLGIETTGRSAAGQSDPRVFDAPFTHAPGHATTSVGLALAKQTAVAHNGHIELGSSDLGGILLRVVLPAASADFRERDGDVRPSRPPPPAPASGPRPIVVWVDEDETFVKGIARYLKSHKVCAACTIAEAQAFLAELRRLPDAIFCDVNLPDGSGIELHRKLHPQFGERFVFVTSGVIPADAANYLQSSGRPTLIKPIAVDEIVDLLAAPHGGSVDSSAGALTLSEPAEDEADTEPIVDEDVDIDLRPTQPRVPEGSGTVRWRTGPPPGKRSKPE